MADTLTDNGAPPADYGERTPPFNLEAEQSVIGGMLLSKEAIDDVGAVMTPADFYQPKHEVIHHAILGLVGQGQPVDVISVTDELTRRKEIERAGGSTYLHTCVSQTVTAANAGFYADIVARHSAMRRLIAAGTRLVQMGYASEGTVDELLSHAQAELDAAANATTGTVRRIRETLMATVIKLDKPAQFLPTPWLSIDRLIGGFSPGTLVVVAARPGAGKTNWVLNAAKRAARHGLVAFVSLEMSEEELQLRLLSDQAEVSMTSIHRHTLTDDERQRITRARHEIQEAPIFINDAEEGTVASIANFARAVSRKQTDTSKLAMVVVDYLQLVDGEGANREQIVGNVAKSLKQLAKRLQVPVVVAAQLNRGERGRGKDLPLPTMRDLRESGGIEANADVVLLLHRDQERHPSKVRVIAAKNRQGTTGVVTLGWQGEYSRMTDRPWSPTLDMEETW